MGKTYIYSNIALQEPKGWLSMQGFNSLFDISKWDDTSRWKCWKQFNRPMCLSFQYNDLISLIQVDSLSMYSVEIKEVGVILLESTN